MRILAILAALGLASCSGSKDAVEIRQDHLRAVEDDPDVVASIRAEQLKRLHGAVSAEERRQRLGHYYTIRWDGPEGREGEPVRVLFRFRQAATGSAIRRMEATSPAGRKGAVEFRVTGSQYLERGRVLAWHLSFFRGGELMETHQSFLWE